MAQDLGQKNQTFATRTVNTVGELLDIWQKLRALADERLAIGSGKGLPGAIEDSQIQNSEPHLTVDVLESVFTTQGAIAELFAQGHLTNLAKARR